MNDYSSYELGSDDRAKLKTLLQQFIQEQRWPYENKYLSVASNVSFNNDRSAEERFMHIGIFGGRKHAMSLATDSQFARIKLAGGTWIAIGSGPLQDALNSLYRKMSPLHCQ